MKTNIGKMACESCGNAVTVKENENGTLSYRCDECDAAPYARTGTLQNEMWRKKVTNLPQKGTQDAPKIYLKQSVEATSLPKHEAKAEVKKPVASFWG